MAESQNKVFAAFWYSIIGRLLCTNSRKEDQKEEKSGVKIFYLHHFVLHSLSPHQPMSASLAFTTQAMRLLEEEQFLQLNKKEKDPLKPKQPMSVFLMFRNEQRVESKSGWEVIEEWNNMTEKQKKPYEKIAKQNMEKYLEEMEAYKQRNEEESANPKKKEDEKMKIHKQDKKEKKTDNIIKKTKENRQKKKKIADSNKPKKPASSFLLFSSYKEARKNLLEERLGINDSTLNALISMKWKELSEEDKQTWNEKAAGAKEPKWNWKTSLNIDEGGSTFFWPFQCQINQNDTSLSLYVHYGQSKPKDAKILSQSDVLQTTYGVLSLEFSTEKAKENGGLYSVRWFRVVPDEAHTIKSSKNQMSMDAATLTADRRWCLTGTDDGSEQWGYVEVQPSQLCAHKPITEPDAKHGQVGPHVLVALRGLGASGVGFGNFLEIGQLDMDLMPLNSTWLTKADLLSVDSPVGTRFSYVQHASLVVRTDAEAAIDLTSMLEALFNGNETLQKSPLFIIAESHGGKFAVTLGLLALKAIEAEELKLQLGDYPNHDTCKSSLAQNIKKEIAEGKYEAATNTWEVLENFISANSNDVDFYNFMLDHGNDPVESRTFDSNGLLVDRYSTYMSTKIFLLTNGALGPDLGTVMNGPIKQKLFQRTWDGQGGIVDKLLAKGVNVTIYNGQHGWEGLKNYLNLSRTPSHFVPVDQPCISLQMISNITRSPSKS
ncbi:unnamed protein product [Camellia sinensis]